MYFPNNSYTGVFIKPRTVTKLRTLGQLRHRNVAIMDQTVLFHLTVYTKKYFNSLSVQNATEVSETLVL